MRLRPGRRLLLCLLSAVVAAAVAAARSGSPLRLAAPRDAPPAAALRFETTTADLGSVPPRAERDVEVAWRREGPGDLRVLAVKTGCGCVRSDGLPPVLSAGASGRLRLRVGGRSTPGPFSVAVRAFTDAPPPDDVATLRVRGFVGDRPVVRPSLVDLGPRSPGVRVTRRLEISLPPGWRGTACEASLDGLAGEAKATEPMLADRAGPDLLVTADVPEEAGTFEGTLRVRFGAGEPIEVPVRGLVVAPSDR
jgi:hypothetical protein